MQFDLLTPLQVLRDILDSLKAAKDKLVGKESASSSKKESSGKKKQKKQREDPREAISSIFASLELEEPSTNPPGSAPSPTHVNSASSPSQVSVKFRLEKEEEDNAFKTWCFLQDLADIFKSVKQNWEDYVKGEVSFFAAGVITDTAFGLLRCADEDFATVSPFGSTDWKKLLDFLGISYFERNKAVWLHPTEGRKAKEPRLPHSDINIVELLCPIAYLCLLSWKSYSNDCCEATKRARRTGEPEIFQAQANSKLDRHFICTLFSKCAVELHGLAHNPAESAWHGEFVQALSGIHHASSIPMSAVAACQINLDIFQILRLNTEHGLHLLRKRVELSCALREDIATYNPTDNWKQPDIRNAVERFDAILRGPAKHVKKMRLPTENVYKPQSAEEAIATKWTGQDVSFIAGCFPAIASNVLSEIELNMYDASTAFASEENYILTIAHMYRALHAMGLLDHEWRDMEFAIAAFATRDPLVPKLGQPYNAKEAEMHYAMAVGISASDFREALKRKGNAKAKHGENAGHIQRHGTARAFDISSPLLNALCDRATEDRHNASTRTFEAVIRALKASGDTTVTKEKHQNKSRRLPTFTACELLDTLRKRLLRDETSLNFDFVRLTLDCANLWKLVSAGLAGMFATTTADRDYKLASMQVFFRGGADSPFCKIAANILRTHIVAQGKKYEQQAFDQSSGRIPKRLRPVFDAHREHAEAALESTRYMLDYLEIKFSVYGSIIAAYHSKFDPRAVRISTSHQSAIKGELGHDTILNHLELPFGDATNDVLDEAAKKHCIRPSDVSFQADLKALVNVTKQHAKGGISDEDLCKAAHVITRCELIPVTIPENKSGRPAEDSHARQIWALDVAPNHSHHANYLNTLTMALGPMGPNFKPTFENECLIIPLDTCINTSTDLTVADDIFRDTLACAYAALQARTKGEPGGMEEKMEPGGMEQKMEPGGMEQKVMDALPEKSKALCEALLGESGLTVEESVRNMREKIEGVPAEDAKGLLEDLLGVRFDAA